MAAFDIPDNWTPNAANIDELPPPLRRYIHDLQTNVDQAGIMRENFRLRQENHALRNECQRLALEVRPQNRA